MKDEAAALRSVVASSNPSLKTHIYLHLLSLSCDGKGLIPHSRRLSATTQNIFEYTKADDLFSGSTGFELWTEYWLH